MMGPDTPRWQMLAAWAMCAVPALAVVVLVVLGVFT